MMKLQEKFKGVQNEYETQKTMTKQQLDEQKKSLMDQFLQEKKKLVDLDQMKALEDQMKTLN